MAVGKPVLQGEALEFPCDYELKIMGRVDENIDVVVIRTLAEHDLQVAADQLKQRPSPKGNYVSISVSVPISSREQLKAIYAALHAQEQVKWLL